MQKNRSGRVGPVLFKSLILVLSLWIAGVSLWGAFHPYEQSGIFRGVMTREPWAGYCHVVGGAFALLLGALQLSSRLRQRRLGLHRGLGQLYVVSVLVSTLGAFVILQDTVTSWHARYGFILLAIVWPTVTLAGYPWRRAFDVRVHGRWMICSYALTCAAITLRLYLMGLLMLGVRFPYAYPIAAWAGGIGNILLVSVILRITSKGSVSEKRNWNILPALTSLCGVLVVWFGVSSAMAPANAPNAPRYAGPYFTISTIAGTGTRGFSGDGGPALAAQIERPTAVAVDSHGNVFVADEANYRVRRIAVDGTIGTVVGTGSTEAQQGNRPATETNLLQAYGIATDRHDNLYVLSRGHAVLFRVGSNGIAERIAGTGVPGFSGDGGPAVEAQIDSTDDLVIDDAGNIYLADTGNQRIRHIAPDGVIRTIAGTGKRGFSGDGGPAIEATFCHPVAIVVDSQGDVYVADLGNHRIRRINIADGRIETVAGNGKPKYNGEGWPALQAQFGEPCGVVVDPDGRIYIADQINRRVRVVAPSGRMYTVAGTGVSGSTGDDGPAENAQISNPDIIALDHSGNLYLPDHQNALIRRLSPRTP